MMIFRAIRRSRSTFRHQITFRSQQLVRNFSILSMNWVTRAQIAASKHLFNLIPAISKTVPTAMGYAWKKKPPVDEDISICTYDEVKEVQKHPKKMLIDVRQPKELEENGKIPGAINIPYRNVRNTLSDSGDSEYFEERYERVKPDKDTYIITSCHNGNNALRAARILEDLGYTNVHCYKGSWLDWAEKEAILKGKKPPK